MPTASIRVSRSPQATPKPFRYFWLKYVDGFNDRTHCLPCLVGAKSKRVGLAMRPAHWLPLDEADARYLYLCGSFADYATNFHVAMRIAPGRDVVALAGNGLSVIVRDVERLAIEPLPERSWVGYSHRQLTCRNFQFGHAVWKRRRVAPYQHPPV